MKLIRVIITVVLLLAGFTSSYPVGVNIGVNAWYGKWDPDFEDSFRGEGNAITANDPVNNSNAYNDSFTIDPCIMAGPVLGLKLSDRWSLGLVFLASKELDAKSSFNVNSPSDVYTYRYNITFRRYDGDMTATYKLNSYFGVFAGFKYLSWYNSGHVEVVSSSMTYTSQTSTEMDAHAYGPALGINFTHPVNDIFFFTASGAFSYLKSSEKHDESLTENFGTPGTPVEKDYEVNSHYRSFNGMAGFGYFLDSLSTTMIIGGRYQYLKNEDTPRDLFYGVTVSAIYSF